MASRKMFDVRTLNQRVCKVVGSFRPAGTGAPVKVFGNGWSVARSGVGVYVITLEDRWARLLASIPGVRVADGTPTIVQFGDYNASAGTLQVRTLQGTNPALADLASDADNVVSFELTFSNTENG